MRRALLMLCALAVLPGCSYILPMTNQPPTAYINSIAPAEVTQGGVVSFSGYGTDADGQVVAYRWRSDRDGQIGTQADFQTSSLSVGQHSIFFMVQDNNGAWSAEVEGSVTVVAQAVAPAQVSSFTASPPTITVGQSTILAWSVANATSISIDQGIGTVQATGSRTVTPSATTTYKITATGDGSTATAQLTVTVAEPTLEILYFNADPYTVPSGDVSTLSWKTTGATQVRILPVVGLVGAEGSVDVTLYGEQRNTFTLTATNGADTVTAEVAIDSYAVMPNHHTVTLTADMDRSGYVRSTNSPWPSYIYVGDDNNNIGLQGFVTFDMSGIPSDATISNVIVDLSNHASTYGDPFGSLGCLRAYVDNYGTLGGSDYYDGTASGAIGRWCSQNDIDNPGAGLTSDFKAAVQDSVGESRFQIRLQFNQDETDSDNNNDMVRWSGTNLPRLIVEYYSYD